MKRLMLTTLATLAFALCDAAPAQMVAVEWDAARQFSKDVLIAPGKFVEACEKLSDGAKVAWSFKAATPLDFNIHYHEGKEVRFPAKKSQISHDAGTLKVKLAQDYCWMWTNKSAAEATLSIKLSKP